MMMGVMARSFFKVPTMYETREKTMNVERRYRWTWAVRALVALTTACVLIAPVGCGDGGGNGAEDTGSILLVSVKPETQSGTSRNVDIKADIDPVTGGPDQPIHDALVGMTFTNRSVVPNIIRPGRDTVSTSDTDTLLRITGYRIDYVRHDLNAPELSSQTVGATFWLGLIGPEETLERNDVLLVPLTTIEEFNQKVAAGAVPSTGFPEYTAHYTFFAETARFNESQTSEVDVSFNMGNFLPNK